MSDQAVHEIETGATAPDGNAAYPLVTFALFAYNQAPYIRQAMEAALAQDYPNLEIIVSDDCSTDDTYSLMEQIAERHEGPHRLIVRRTEKNCGSLLHVADVAKIARGALLVLAAGDDVSKANRVSVLQEAWARTGAWGLCSRYDRIDVDGRLLVEAERAAVTVSHGFDRYFFPEDGPVQVVHGCTSAYDARVFDHLKLEPGDYILSEDGAMSVLLNLMGKDILHLEESLVMYRENPGSLTNNVGRRPLSWPEVARDEANIQRFAVAQANRCRLFLRMDKQLGSQKVRSIRDAGVNTELRSQEAATNWYAMSLAARVACIIDKRLPWKWALPRVLGRTPLFSLKWIASRFH